MADNTSEYGGFWARTAAYSVDSAIVVVLCLAVAIAGSLLGPIGTMIAGVAAFLLQLLYWPVMESSARQATFGKQLLGLQVTTVAGARISFLRALGRNLAKMISAMLLCIGFIMVAFTGKKQGLHDMIAGCTVPRTGPSQFMKVVVVSILAAVVSGAGLYYYASEVWLPQMKTETMGGLEAAMKAEIAKGQAEAARPAQPAAPQPAAPAAAPAPASPMTPAPEFDALVGGSLTGVDRPNTVRVGPAIVELSTFFPSSFWLKVNLPMIKDVDVGPPPEIAVTKVLDAAGKNWYDAANTFEKDPFFRRARLTPELKPVPHFEGTRTVNIEKGLNEGDFRSVEGELRIFIPADVKSESLQASDVGKERQVNGATIILKSLNGAEAVLRYRGPSANLIGVRGVASGKLVDIESRQLPGDAKAVDMDMSVKFKGPVSIVEVVTTSGVASRNFPFVLKRGDTAGPAGAAPPAAAAAAPKAEARPEARPLVQDKPADAAKPAAEARPAARRAPRPPKPAAEPAKPAPQPETKPAPPAPACVIKPVMTDAELEACRRDRSPGISAAPAAESPTAAAIPARSAAAPAATCTIKPVMTAADMEACRRP